MRKKSGSTLHRYFNHYCFLETFVALYHFLIQTLGMQKNEKMKNWKKRFFFGQKMKNERMENEEKKRKQKNFFFFLKKKRKKKIMIKERRGGLGLE